MAESSGEILIPQPIEAKEAEIPKRPPYMESPLRQDIFQKSLTPEIIEASEVPIEASELTIELGPNEDLPKLTFYSDTHLMASQPSKEGIHGLGAGKRRVLGEFKVVRNLVRKYDTSANLVMHKIRPYFQKRFREGGLIVHGGDVTDAFETGLFLRTCAKLERYFEHCRRDCAPSEDENLPPCSTIWLTGNHDCAFTGLDKKLYYDILEKDFGMLEMEEFMKIVKAVEAGQSWRYIAGGWRETHKPDQTGNLKETKRALHPVQRWWLQKLAFGPSIGRYTKEIDGTKTQILFLNSELDSQSGSPIALENALRKMGLDEDDSPYKNLCGEMKDYIRKEKLGQEVLIQAMLEDCEAGAKTIIYTHDPMKLQEQLVRMKQRRLEAMGKNKAVAEREARELVQEKIVIWSGHFHTGRRDLKEIPLGAEPVEGVTRQFFGPVAQKAGRPPENPLTFNPYKDKDTPAVLEGPLDNPQKISIEKVKEEFARLQNIALNF